MTLVDCYHLHFELIKIDLYNNVGFVVDTFQDGNTYIHCDVCRRCVKPSRVHCNQCNICDLPQHVCGQSVKQGK